MNEQEMDEYFYAIAIPAVIAGPKTPIRYKWEARAFRERLSESLKAQRENPLTRIIQEELPHISLATLANLHDNILKGLNEALEELEHGQTQTATD